MSQFEKVMELLGLMVQCINNSGAYNVEEIDIENGIRPKYIFHLTTETGNKIRAYLTYSGSAKIVVSDMASGIVNYIPHERQKEFAFVLFEMNPLRKPIACERSELSLTKQLIECSARHDNGSYVPAID